MAITGGSVAHLCPTARVAFPSPSTLRQRNPLPAIDDATITSPAEAEQPGMDLEVTWRLLEALTEGTVEKRLSAIC